MLQKNNVQAAVRRHENLSMSGDAGMPQAGVEDRDGMGGCWVKRGYFLRVNRDSTPFFPVMIVAGLPTQRERWVAGSTATMMSLGGKGRPKFPFANGLAWCCNLRARACHQDNDDLPWECVDVAWGTAARIASGLCRGRRAVASVEEVMRQMRQSNRLERSVPQSPSPPSPPSSVSLKGGTLEAPRLGKVR